MSSSYRALQAAALLAIACAFDTPLRFVVALPLVVASLVLAVLSLRDGELGRASAQRVPWALIASMSALGIVTGGTSGPVWYEVARRVFAATGILLVGVASGPNPRSRRRAIALAIGGATALAFVTPLATPHPQIDVVPWTDAAVRAFLNHTHPYTAQAADVYRGGRDFGFVVTAYPYMPATPVAFAPAVLLLGDYRYALAACLPLTLWLVRRVGLRSGAEPSVVDAATLLVALHPCAAVVVRSGWNEPLLGVVAAVFALALVCRWRAWSAVAALLLPAGKQYALAPALLWGGTEGRHTRWTAWAIGLGVAAMTVLPFVLWDARATLTGILFQMRAPAHPRLTSISLPGVLAATSVNVVPGWISPVAQLAVSAVLLLSGTVSTPSRIMAGSAIALLVTFLLGWQAFVNYYAFIGTLLVLAAVTSREHRQPA